MNSEKKLIISNWKNHPDSLAEAREILEFADNYLGSLGETKEFSLIFCPPFIFLEEVSKILKTSRLEHESFLGAQDIAPEDRTSLTGEVSGPMLSKIGVRYVIIGHSERRWKLGESDAEVNKKLKSAINNEFIPIVCIGEKTQEGNYTKFIEDQVRNTFQGLTTEEISKCIIAYEPVWAISTNPNARPDTPESALESIAHIKKVLNSLFNIHKPFFIYGGSVNSKNINDFLEKPEISGALIGGASVNKEEFARVLERVSKL